VDITPVTLHPFAWFAVGLVTGWICGSVMMAMLFTWRAERNAEPAEFAYYEASVRAPDGDMPTSEDISSGEVVE